MLRYPDLFDAIFSYFMLFSYLMLSYITLSLAILKDGKNMIGKKLFAVSPLKNISIEVEVISSHYVDHEGKRVRS